MTTLTLSKNPNRSVQCKTKAITRTMTTGTAAFRLPSGSRIIGFVLSGVASNAVTTATLSIGSTQANANEYVSAFDVKGSGNGVQLLNGVAGAVGQVAIAANDQQQIVWVKYAETGGASSVGAWQLFCLYTSGEFTR